MSADVLLVLSLSNFKYRNILFFHSHYDPFIGKSFSQIVSRDSSKKDRTGLTRYSKVKVQSLDMATFLPYWLGTRGPGTMMGTTSDEEKGKKVWKYHV